VLVLGERLSPAAWLGVGLLLAGLLVIQRPWRVLTGGVIPAGAGFALLTGAMIATYSAIDRVGVQVVPPWLFAAILWPACAAGLVVVDVVRTRQRRRAAARDGGPDPGPPPVDAQRAVAGGLLTFAAYGLVLAALARAPLAIVAPLRESAVVLATLWGTLRLGEAADRREVTFRVSGAVLVVAGAVALAVSR
jgi:drug/metabolite transporter (DMT)-like permease